MTSGYRAFVMALLAAVVLFSVLSVAQSAAPVGYAYVKTLGLAGSPDGTLAGYQMKLIVHSGPGIDKGQDVYLNGNSLSWPYDIRFAGAGGEMLPYWIEAYDGKTATVWVRVRAIPKSGTTVKIYYGKYEDTGASDGSGTFEIFDDFSGQTLNAGMWTINGNGTGRIDSGSLYLGASSPDSIQAYNKISIGSPSYAIEAGGRVVSPYTYPGINGSYYDRYYSTVSSAGKYRPGILFREGNTANSKAVGFDTWSYDIDAWTVFDWPNWTSSKVYRPANISIDDAYGGRFRLDVIVDGQAYTCREDLRNVTITGHTDLAGTHFALLSEKCANEYDWVFVRKYTPNEPAWTAQNATPVYTIISDVLGNPLDVAIIVLIIALILLVVLLVAVGAYVLLR